MCHCRPTVWLPQLHRHTQELVAFMSSTSHFPKEAQGQVFGRLFIPVTCTILLPSCPTLSALPMSLLQDTVLTGSPTQFPFFLTHLPSSSHLRPRLSCLSFLPCFQPPGSSSSDHEVL